MENNRECYHCVANHPELTISLYEYGFRLSTHRPPTKKPWRLSNETVARTYRAMGSDEPAVGGNRPSG